MIKEIALGDLPWYEAKVKKDHTKYTMVKRGNYLYVKGNGDDLSQFFVFSGSPERRPIIMDHFEIDDYLDIGKACNSNKSMMLSKNFKLANEKLGRPLR